MNTENPYHYEYCDRCGVKFEPYDPLDFLCPACHEEEGEE